jgi:hypothetical protein
MVLGFTQIENMVIIGLIVISSGVASENTYPENNTQYGH